MKKVGVIIAIILFIGVGFSLTKNIMAKNALSAGVKAVTGLRLETKSVNVGILNTTVGINDLKLFNPHGFPDKVMVDLPEIYVNYDLGAILKKKAHLEEVRLNLKEFVVVKNGKGEINLDSLKVVQAKREDKRPSKVEKEKAKGLSFQIDKLQLKIGKVIYKDYSKGVPPKVREFNLNIDESYENITDPNALVMLIVFKALTNTTIGSLANFDIGSLTEGVLEGIKGTTAMATETVGKTADVVKDVGESTADTLKKSAEEFKKILPFDK